MAQVIYEFELPDGSILEIEGDEGKQAEATAKAKEYIAAQQPTPLTGKERAVDIGRSIATGAYKGIAGTAGLPGMLERGLEALVTPTPKPTDVGKKQPITKYFEALRNLRGMISPLPSLATQPITEKFIGAMNYRCVFPIQIRKNLINADSPFTLQSEHKKSTIKGMFSFVKAGIAAPKHANQGITYNPATGGPDTDRQNTGGGGGST